MTALLNTRQAAELLGMKPQTLVVWRHEGRTEPRYVRLLGKTIRYKLSDLEAFIAASAVAAK